MSEPHSGNIVARDRRSHKMSTVTPVACRFRHVLTTRAVFLPRYDQFIMAARKLDNYLRTHRKRSGLAQHEISFILGTRCGTKISRYERWVRQPRLDTAFQLATLFGCRVEDLFGGLYEQARRQTEKRLRLLFDELRMSGSDARLNLIKVEFLQETLRRIQNELHHDAL